MKLIDKYKHELEVTAFFMVVIALILCVGAVLVDWPYKVYYIGTAVVLGLSGMFLDSKVS